MAVANAEAVPHGSTADEIVHYPTLLLSDDRTNSTQCEKLGGVPVKQAVQEARPMLPVACASVVGKRDVAVASELADPDDSVAAVAVPESVKKSDDEAFWTAAQQALQERERREKVDTFLKLHGFSAVNARKGWLIWRYPLHVAVDKNDVEMVSLLLKSSADKKLRDSTGRTPLQLARERNQYGSHLAVLKAFGRRKKREPIKIYDMPEPVPASSAAVMKCEVSIQCDLDESDGDAI